MRHPFGLARIATILLLTLLTTACTRPAPLDTTVNSPGTITAQSVSQTTSTSTQIPVSISSPTATPTLTPVPPTPRPVVRLEAHLPPALQKALLADQALNKLVNISSDADTANYHFEVCDEDPLAQWVYVLVAPFPTIPDGIYLTDLLDSWSGKASGPFAGQPILMEEGTLSVLKERWGDPGRMAVKTLPQDELLNYAWDNHPAWAIIPFEALEPRWKVLEVDGQSPIRHEFSPSAYPLTISFCLHPVKNEINTLSELSDIAKFDNWDTNKITTVALTGVTALVRGTALTIEQKGISYPAEEIGQLLRSADITHISNEIPFTPDCPFPQLYPGTLIFCSDPDYISLLEIIGADVVELTGDHFADYGKEATQFTLEMYQTRGIPYYGGGENALKARQPVLFEHNGNRLAFIGCNIGCQAKPEISCQALATDDQPGAAVCDFDYIAGEVERLENQGYHIITTLQHKEYYTYTAPADLVHDFTFLANAGASIVSGSQSHQPHNMTFSSNAFLHYGLGNLFFDQKNFCAYHACNNSFIDWHVFYDGKYISTVLIPITFVDLAKTRLMTTEERASFLELIFNASGW